jgi:exodeoxyribonuclease VII small subunit
MSNKPARQFEDELADLEAVVTRIDSGELSLEESITAFERGVALVRSLNKKLDEVDRRVEVLTRGPHGELNISPYQGEGVAAEAINGVPGNAPEDEDDIPS